MADKSADTEAPSNDDEAAWAKASPRLKAIVRESLNEWLAENDKPATAETDTEDEEEDAEDTDDRGKPAAAGKRIGRATAAAAAGGKSGAPKRARQARPSGGSFLDIIIGR